jgi:homocysteine S-methyltransferase
LADGSEYRGDYGLSVAALREFHRPRLQILAESGADVLAVETIPCLAEVEALVVELELLQAPAWLSVSAAGELTRAREPLAEVFALAAGCSAIIATGVNCVDPDDVSAAVRSAAASSGKPVVAYPNGGEEWDAAARAWTGPSHFDPAAAAEWVQAGARLIGGCCRVRPADIAALRATIEATGHRGVAGPGKNGAP